VQVTDVDCATNAVRFSVATLDESVNFNTFTAAKAAAASPEFAVQTHFA